MFGFLAEASHMKPGLWVSAFYSFRRDDLPRTRREVPFSDKGCLALATGAGLLIPISSPDTKGSEVVKVLVIQDVSASNVIGIGGPTTSISVCDFPSDSYAKHDSKAVSITAQVQPMIFGRCSKKSTGEAEESDHRDRRGTKPSGSVSPKRTG